jgi:hypothetical protein
MNNIFDYINDILFIKKGDKLSNIDDESQFNLYLINRWLSMYSPEIATVVNSTGNWLYSIFEDKKLYYNFLINVVPKLQRKHISYIKKVKPDESPEESNNNVELLAQSLEISRREINDYIHYERQHRPTSTD